MHSKKPISEILDPFSRDDPSSLIPVLQAVQTEHGYLSERHVYTISEHLGISSSKIYGVATFYSQFRLEPLGRHVINLCQGTACHVKGAEKLIPIFEQELNCKAGETTKDGKFTFNLVACLGACALSPVVNIDSDFYGNIKIRDIKKILRKYD